MTVPLGKNELPALLEEIEQALADGKSLKEVLQKQIDKHTLADGTIPGTLGGLQYSGVDLIFIDPRTGEVKDSAPKSRPHDNVEGAPDADYDSVKALADDLATFIRLTFLRTEYDDADEIAKIFAEIKARRYDAGQERFG